MAHGMPDPSVIVWVVATLVAANVVVSVGVIRMNGLTPFQMAAQVLIVWLVPLFGVIFVGTFWWNETHPRRPLSPTASSGEVSSGGHNAQPWDGGGGHAS
jgi:hypothetical protein